MAIPSKCTRCGHLYPNSVLVCQLCGGSCVPDSTQALRLSPRAQSAESVETPGPSCPCCDEAPGPYTIAQQTRHLKEVSLVPPKRTYLVTTVKVPGVCGSCHRSLQRKRVYAGVLTTLPLPLIFGILIMTDQKAFFALLVIYGVYLVTHLTYSWADFLLYGQTLSWQLKDYVPAKEESSPRYPSGWAHGIARLVLYPAVVVLLAGLLAGGIVMRKRSSAAQNGAAPTAESAAPVPAQPARIGTSLEEARTFFRTAQGIAVPIETKLAIASRGVPAKQSRQIEGKSATVVVAYADEANMPAGAPYELMNGARLLEHHGFTYADYLSIDDRKILVPLSDVLALSREITGPKEPRSALKQR